MKIITPNIERALDIHNHLGETPVWSEAEAALYWINVESQPELLRWHPGSAAVKRWPMPERIGGFVLKQGGGALVVLASGLYDFDFASGNLAPRVRSPLSSQFALHECACDPTGRFWVGSINLAVQPDNLNAGGGKFFRLQGNELVPVIEGISCANGLAFSPDGRSLYISDSPTARVDRWDLDPQTGALSNCRTLFQLAPGEGFVDGATVDREGGYWATLVFGSALRRYLPDGTLDLEVKLPFLNPTKVAFGGERLETLFITSTSEYIAADKVTELDGGLFAFKPGVAGCPEPRLPA